MSQAINPKPFVRKWFAEKTSTAWRVMGVVNENGAQIIVADYLNQGMAKLIAASPDLLEALKESLHWLRGSGKTIEHDSKCDTLNQAEEMIRAAIAKAEGGAA